VPSTKNPSTRPVANIARAAQRTRSVIEDFQTRLTEVSQHAGLARLATAVGPEKSDADTTGTLESEAELERQLAAYFARASAHTGPAASGSPDRSKVLEELRARVIGAVVERILADWSSGQSQEPSALRDEVMERLIERVLQQFGTSGPAETEARPS
jgi:hypothetical protein